MRNAIYRKQIMDTTYFHSESLVFNFDFDIFQVKNLNMALPDSQWLYVITDSVIRNSTNITSFVELLSEGSNVAFIYNATDSDTYCNVIY